MNIRIQGIATDAVEALRNGGPDANGQAPLRRVADGSPSPCRHCIDLIAPGEEKLVLAWRPFDAAQPYAETGPIFLHARECVRYDADAPPPWFHFLDPAIVRGYGSDDWIRYDTGRVVRGPEIAEASLGILADPTIAYVHVRSKFNCFQCRVDRG